VPTAVGESTRRHRRWPHAVGSGSLIIVSLLALYPLLRASQLVGTDLVQAVPLVTAAAVGHLIFGDFQFEVATALVVGSVPGVWVGP
jgi:uncharacterized protein